MTQDTRSVALLLDEAFSKAAWHGPSPLGALGHDICHTGRISLLRRMAGRP